MEHKFRTVLLLGTYTNQASESLKDYFVLTETAKVLDMNLKGSLISSLIADGPYTDVEKIKVFRFTDPTVLQYVKKYDQIAIVNLGPHCVPEDLQNVGIKIENIFEGIAHAIRYLKLKYYFQYS